jgi:alpha-mannosidase
MVRQFQLAQVAFQELLDCQPEIFVRRRFGLTTSTPGLLKQAGFTGAIHATLDDGQFPQSPNTVMRWTGNDEASLLALGIPPLDASDAGALLRLGLGIGEQIDSSHTATVVFAHWPGRVCDSFNDLLRIAKWAPLLGEFTRLNEYFDSAYDPGFPEDFTADQYRDPFLQQAVAAQAKNPISRFVDYWRCHYQLAGCTAMLAQCVSAGDVARVPPGGGQPAAASKLREDLWSRVSELSKRLDAVVDAANAEVWDAINDEISRLENSVANQIATAVGTGYFFNPTNHKQRIRHSTPSNGDLQIKDTGPIVFADTGAGQTDWVIEVPGMGFASIEAQAGNPKQPDPFRRDPPVLQDHVLRNEFFELHIDEQTGGIRSLQVYGGRNNLLSQQLAARLPQREQNEHSPDADSGGDAGKSNESRGPRLTKTRYTTMVADEIETVASCRIHGSIISKGRLLDGDQTVARFTQTVSLSRGIPIAEVEIAIEPLIEMSDSINHYFCNRMAWKDESSSVVSNDLENEQAVISDWFLGTHYININQDDHAVTMLTGGLPFHRRVSRRMIDSLLIVGQEQRRTFRLGLGVDVRYPLMTATQWMSPAVWVAAGANPAEPSVERNDPQGWFFHFDCRNVMATWWEPIFAEGRFAEGKESEIVGVQIRMRETLGRPGRLTLRCPHPIATAERRSLAGESLQTVPVDESNAEHAIVDFAAWEYFQIAIRW